MKFVPERGHILIVNFEIGGVQREPEMNGSARPCVIVQNNRLERGPLVTVVPVSTTPPRVPGKQHHLLSHLSFRGWPMQWDGQGKERWVKCDYVTTISLERCTQPYSKTVDGRRRYTRVKVTRIDMEAIDQCVLWALGILCSSDAIANGDTRI